MNLIIHDFKNCSLQNHSLSFANC